MKIRSVTFNNRRKNFEVKASGKTHAFPYVKAMPSPRPDDPVSRAYVDRELGGDGFRYGLQSGKSGTVHIEQVLEYNRDPNYLRDLMLYKLTLEAQRRIKHSRLSKREISRRLGTSATQLYRRWIKRITRNHSISSCPCFSSWSAMLSWWSARSLLE